MEPITCSPAMRVHLDGRSYLLKLYDRFLCHEIRKYYQIPPWNSEREFDFQEFMCSPQGSAFLAMNEDDLEYESVAEEEAFIHHRCMILSSSEMRAYQAMESLQDQRRIPKLHSTVIFVKTDQQDSAEFSIVPGILLEYIDGFTLSELTPAMIPVEHWPKLADDALETIREAGKLGVLNYDVKLHNFLVEKKTHRVVQFDFAICEFSAGFESERWRRKKAVVDEEGTVGYLMEKKIRKNGGVYKCKPSGMWGDTSFLD